MTRNDADAVSAAQLRLAVERGVITPDQFDRLLALASTDQTAGAPADPSKGINLIQILYWAGALAVLFAMGWFLADKWKSLHAAGVLLVVALYALAFVLSSVLLTKLNMPGPAALLALLAVGMAPLMTWALESLAGVWPPPVVHRASMYSVDPIASVRWIPVELSAALAGLVAMRKVHKPLLALSVSVPFALSLIHATPLYSPELNWLLWGWVTFVSSAVLITSGYVIERRAGASFRDHATVVYFTGLVFLGVAYLAVSDQTRAVPHSLPFTVALLVGLSAALRRSVFLLFAAMLFVVYLGFLAGDVFASATGFMVVMVAAGAVLILSTVLVQRRFPGLLRGWRDDAGPRPRMRGDIVAFGAVVAATLALLAFSVPRARVLNRARIDSDTEQARLRANARQPGRTSPSASAAGAETATSRRP